MNIKQCEKTCEVSGLKASPGIVIGRVVVVDNLVAWQRIRLLREEIPQEILRFKVAIAKTEHQLMDIRDQFTEYLPDYSSIINSHVLILKDGMISNQTVKIMEKELINAEWALDKALQAVEARFDRLTDPYMKERFNDVRQVVERIYRLLGGEEKVEEFTEKVILAARDFSPEDTLRMNQDRILGFMTDIGGVTSHTSIVARTLGIPAVVGLGNITGQVATGDLVIIDGNSGQVFLHPTPDKLNFYREYQIRQKRFSEQINLYAHLPSETIDGLQIQVKANIETLDEVALAIKYGAFGIGLFRSEFYYLGSQEPPSEELLFELYYQLLTRLTPIPVTIRTFDLGGDKIADNIFSPDEKNPALGLRAIRFSLQEGNLFKTQLRALLRAGFHGHLRILFPMISSLDELLQAKEMMKGVKEGLRRDGLPFGEEIEVGVMIEVPSAVAVADDLAREVDFFSIGTNDLIQYALAIDRGNENVAHMYEPLHPAILRMISQVVESGHKIGIDVGLCGEMAGDLTYLPLLLGLGIDELSMHPLAIPYIKKMIRSSKAGEMDQLAREALTFSTAAEIKNHLSDYLSEKYPDEFGSPL